MSLQYCLRYGPPYSTAFPRFLWTIHVLAIHKIPSSPNGGFQMTVHKFVNPLWSEYGAYRTVTARF